MIQVFTNTKQIYRHYLPYGLTQCHLSSDISEHAPPNSSHTGWYSIHLYRRDGRL